MPFDWQLIHARERQTPAVVDPRRRLRICMAALIAALLVIFGRIVQLEATSGEGYRAEAMRPIEKQTDLPAPRGRIVSHDGVVLAHDQPLRAVAVEYAWLREPAEAGWLRMMARSRLSKIDRKSPEKVAQAKAAVLADRAALTKRLAALCGLSLEQWTARTHRIQDRIERIAETANRRQATSASGSEDTSWAARIRRFLLEEPPPPRIVVAEELDHHVVVEGVSKKVVSEIESKPEKYPGTKIVEVTRRIYPEKTLAAHVVGHLGPVEEADLKDDRYAADDWIGRDGVERQYEEVLRGRRGVAVQRIERGGRVLASFRPREPQAGHNVVLTLHATLQKTAEELLNDAMRRRAVAGDATESAGGAVVVMDVQKGSILAAASAPGFDPNWFSADNREKPASLLADQSHPLFNRVCSMAIPPGSTFKTLTAVALLESGGVDPQQSFTCQGYLSQPDRQRCQIFVRQGIGHGEVTLADALAVSCNVYFFHFAGRMGPRPLVAWAERFGFGHTTGVDLPGESPGILPSPENVAQLAGHAWRTADTQSMAIGQGLLTATPLQVLRMMAAVANGGRLIAPHVVDSVDEAKKSADSTSGITLSPRTLQVVREGLRRVVADPSGTAHATVYLDSVAIAGKTGTAETGPGQASHAWFAGYVPAEEPLYAFVVVLEHAGDASTAACPLVKRLVLRMQQLGML